MPKKRHKAMQLANATKVMRAHSTDIDPPGLVEFENAFQSRSDNAITLRSDWEAAFAGMQSLSDALQGDDQEDYLNAAFHVSRAGYTIYFGRWAPFTWAEEAGDLFTLYDTGAIGVDGLRTEVIGTDTEWLQQVWPGCLIKSKDDPDGKLYSVTYVTSDTRLLTDEPMQFSGEYEIYRVHPSNRGEWPIKFESLGGYLIYGSVDITQPIESRFISGPFFSNIGRPNLGVWFGTDPVADAPVIPMATISVGFDYPNYGLVLWRYRMKYFTPIIVAGDKGVMFARNWIGDDISVGATLIRATSIATKLISTGGVENITYGRCQTSTAEIVSTAGEFIQMDSDPQSLDEANATLYSYPEANESIKDTPLGDVIINSWLNSTFLLGNNGLMGDELGATYSTGVSVALRKGVEFYSAGAGHYVVVGDADSTDGVILYFDVPAAISRATTGTAESFTGVTFSRYIDRLVAVGTAGECMTSDDLGVNWTSRSVGASSDLRAVVADAQGRAICAVGDIDPVNAACYLSMDGITWEQVITGSTENLVDVTFCETDGAFYAVNEVGQVYRIRRRVQIPAGTLLLSTFGENSDYVSDVFHDGVQFVAVGSKIWASADAVTWVERQIGPPGNYYPDLPLTSVTKDVTGGTDWVAVGVGGHIYRSANNGITWAEVSSPVTVDLVGVIHHEVSGLTPGDFLAIGKEGKVMKSIDGSSWTLMSFPTATDLYSITSDSKNTSVNQKNVYISAGDGLVYTTRGNRNSYQPWQAWEDRPDMVYTDREDVATSEYYRRSFSTFQLRAYHSMQGMLGPNNLSGSARLVAAQWNTQHTFNSLDDNTSGRTVFRFQVGTNERYVSGGGGFWTVNAPHNTCHSFCLLGDKTNWPILVRRVWTLAYSGVSAFDGILTSTDFGLTWSTEEFPNTDLWQKPQAFTHISSRGVWLAGRYFAPICTDETDFFAIQSSNQLSSKPVCLYMSGLELVFDVEEVE